MVLTELKDDILSVLQEFLTASQPKSPKHRIHTWLHTTVTLHILEQKELIVLTAQSFVCKNKLYKTQLREYWRNLIVTKINIVEIHSGCKISYRVSTCNSQWIPYFLKFLLNFAVGLGLGKLSARNFLRTRKFWSCGIHYHLHAMWFPRRYGTVTLLIFLLSGQLLTMSLLWYLQPASNNARVPSGCASHTARTRSLATQGRI